MICQTTKNSTIKQFNVTDMTPSQKRKLFAEYLIQAGFTSFNKKRIGKQIYYTFTYRNSINYFDPESI